MRNSVVLATLGGIIGLYLIDPSAENYLRHIWLVCVYTIILRGVFGLLRIWPGFGRAPLGSRNG